MGTVVKSMNQDVQRLGIPGDWTGPEPPVQGESWLTGNPAQEIPLQNTKKPHKIKYFYREDGQALD